jgi:hypothetical protein
MSNPYPRLTGFSNRVAYAERKLRELGRDPYCDIFSRKFDDCFEMGDGDAVVFALMTKATRNPLLLQGIQRLDGGEVPQRWQEVFQGHFGQMNLLEPVAS